jgi:hypothetical protein
VAAADFDEWFDAVMAKANGVKTELEKELSNWTAEKTRAKAILEH